MCFQITSVERGEDTVQLTGLGAGKHYRISVSRVANDRVGRPNRFRATVSRLHFYILIVSTMDVA